MYLRMYYRVYHNYLDWAKYQNRHSSKSICVMKLFFCQNSPLMGQSFWQKNSFITIYFLSYAYFDIQPSPDNYESPSIVVLNRKSRSPLKDENSHLCMISPKVKTLSCMHASIRAMYGYNSLLKKQEEQEALLPCLKPFILHTSD